MMIDLAAQKCVPCRKGIPKLSETEIAELLPHVPKWQVVEGSGSQKLERTYKFGNFSAALAFVNQVGALAEAEDHHPRIVLEICLSREGVRPKWEGCATVQWWTYVIGGLHRNDFILAARTDLSAE